MAIASSHSGSIVTTSFCTVQTRLHMYQFSCRLQKSFTTTLVVTKHVYIESKWPYQNTAIAFVQ